VTPTTDLVSTVRRKHVAAQRRRVAVRVGVPAVAAASVGVALAVPAQHAATHRAPQAARVSTPLPISSSNLAQASYRVAFPQKFGTVGCVERPASGQASTWLLEAGNCGSGVSAVITTDTSLPADAKPIAIDGLTGVYGRTDGDTRTVWAHNDRGSYSALTVNASTPDSDIAAFFTPAS